MSDCNPIDYSPPGSSVCVILQERILAWVAVPFSSGSSQPWDQTLVSRIAGRFFTICAKTRGLFQAELKCGIHSVFL